MFGNVLRRRLWVVALIGVLALSLLVTGCAKNEPAQKPTVVVGAKGFTEGLIVGQMAVALLQDAGYPVEFQELGGTGVLHEALKKGDIDTYVEYTGTALTAILNLPVISDPQQVYDKIKAEYATQFDLTWLEPWGFNDTYCITIRQEDADSLGLKTISDIAKQADQMILGCTTEFANRADGLPGLASAYGIKFKAVKTMETGLMYEAVAQKQVDAISAFSTDGRIPALNLVNLVDDRSFFPPYFAAPVVRGDLLKEAPEVADILNKLAGVLDDQAMADLNMQVDNDKKDPADVAKEFLRSKGLIK